MEETKTKRERDVQRGTEEMFDFSLSCTSVRSRKNAQDRVYGCAILPISLVRLLLS